jgi:hypothetical protein
MSGLRLSLVLGLCLISVAAEAQEPAATDEAPAATGDQPAPPPAEKPAATPQPPPTGAAVPEKVPPVAPAEPSGWHTEIHGYLRAPVSLGLSERPSPDDMAGPSKLQVSYGPNRVFDWNYYSFAYTRLQEQDWAELFVHEKKKHVEAVLGWMGYWFQGAGFRNPDAAWIPGMAYLTLDTDFKAGGVSPNAALTVGAWWPRFGYFEKYDTYTLGRFRQIGGQGTLTVPFGPDFTVVLTGGFGTARDGSYNFTLNNISPLYAGQTDLDLLTWINLQLLYQKYVDVGLHLNTEWMADPSLIPDTMMNPKSFTAASAAHLSVAGAEVNLQAPYLGHLWISPSYISVRNGWALGQGTEVMHGLGGLGVAFNYLGWNNSPTDSTGSGSMINLGFMYENSVSGILGKPRGSMVPDLTVSVFGLFTSASLDLPAATTTLKQNSLQQIKYGADATVQMADWVSFMLRGDIVDYDLAHDGYIFAILTARLQIASQILSSERIYLQYSRYKYGDKMVLNATWPVTTLGGGSLVQGSSVIQQAPAYSGKTPDENVVKLQAEISF